MGAVDPHADNRTWCRDLCGLPRSCQILMAGVFVSIERYGFSKKCNRITAQLFCTNRTQWTCQRLTLMRIRLMIHRFNVLYSVTNVHCMFSSCSRIHVFTHKQYINHLYIEYELWIQVSLGSEQTKREAKSINYQSTIRIEMCMQSKYVALQ